MTCCDLLGRVGFGLGRRLRPGQDRNLRHFAENKSSVPNLRASSVPHQTKCVCGELWVGRRLRPGITHMAGYSARCETQVFRPKVPDKIRSTSVSTLVRWTFGGSGDSGLESPIGRILRSSWNKLVPPKSPGEHPSHTREKSMRHSEEVVGVSALESPKYPETPPQLDKSQKDLRLLFSEPLLTTHTKPENLSL